MEEICGIAEGASCDVREIVAINACTELLYGVTHQPECTAIAVSSSASADGHTRLAQNWDWHPSLVESIASIIFDVTEGTIDIADGSPCQHAYQRHNIDHLL
jgi:hypothetical protein